MEYIWVNGMYKKKCAVILLAGGLGKRFDNKKPKQFHLLDGEPVIIRALRPFVENSSVPISIIVVVSPSLFFQKTEKILRNYFPSEKRIHLIKGGKHRIHSYFKAITFLNTYLDTSSVVIAHDAARPLIEKKDVEELYKTFLSKKADALLVLRPLPESLFKKENNGQLTCVPREGYFLGQSPNLFKKDLLQHINHTYGKKGKSFSATQDIVGLIPKGCTISGHSLAHANIKITHQDDLHMVHELMQRRKK